MTLQAVIFDFDGVLADSEPIHLRAYQAVLEPEGIHLAREEYDDRYLGFDDAGLFWQLAGDRHLDVSADIVERWIDAKTSYVQRLLASDSILFPGAAACVRDLSTRVPLAIASGALEPEIALVLEAAGLRDRFKAVASASDGVRGKPEPDLYLLALAKLRQSSQVDAASCVAVEDSIWGLRAAQAAGLRTAAVTHTYSAAQLAGADLVVETLSELTLDRLASLIVRG